DDTHPSLGISVSDNGSVLLICRSRRCSVAKICEAIGLRTSDLFPASNRHSSNDNGHRRIVATYDYVDEAGCLLYQAVRFEPKDFLQRRRDPNAKDRWAWNLGGVARVLYRLPQLLNAPATELVFVPEGEKDVDRLCNLGLVATTNAMGAGKWRPEY